MKSAFYSTSTILWFLFVLRSCYSKVEKHHEYLCNCTLYGVEVQCMVALFSAHQEWSVSSALEDESELPREFLNGLSPACSPKDLKKKSDNGGINGVLIARRGECSFDQKSRIAAALKFRALVIVNAPSETDGSNSEELFPMGSAEENYKSSIPTVLVSYTTWETIIQTLREKCSPNSCPLEFGNQKNWFGISWKPHHTIRPPVQAIGDGGIGMNANVLDWMMCTMGISTIIVGALVVFNLDRFIVRRGTLLIMLVGYLSTFFVLRLGTMRVMNNFGNGMLSSVNHRETDELIYEELIRTTNPFDIFSYTLQGKGVIEKFSLSEENYDFPLFIHPPIFVLLSKFIVSNLEIPLFMVPVMMQSIGIIATLVICLEIAHTMSRIDGFGNHSNLSEEDKEEIVYGTAASMFNYTCFTMLSCPILWFISQKVWIDNCLLMTIMVAVAGHMAFCRRMVASSSWKFLSFLSGFLWVGLALNCKVTALGIVPFMVGWMWFLIFACMKDQSLVKTWSRCLYATFFFCFGTFISVSPWISLYWYMTGRILPSAWPSEDMIERFPFIRAAVNKPWYFYITSLLGLSPLHIGALLYCCYQTIWYCGSLVMSRWRSWKEYSQVCNHRLLCIVLALWPTSFLCTFTLLGAFGAGFQLRFIAPMLPGTALLVALGMTGLYLKSDADIGSGKRSLVTFLFNAGIIFTICNGFYYGVLYPPLYADLHYHIFDIIRSILENPYEPIPSQESMKSTIKFMAHHGLKLS